MKLKMEKKLAKVYTKDGLVQIKETIGSEPKTIRSARDLDIYMAETGAIPQVHTAVATPAAVANPSSAPTQPIIATANHQVNGNGQQMASNGLTGNEMDTNK